MSVETFEKATVQVKDYAEMAISSAREVLQLVLDRDDLRSALVGMPIYFHGMINFAAVFLLKTAKTTFIGLTSVDTPEVLRLVQKCIGELQSQRAAPQHLVYHLSSGLEGMVKKIALSSDDAGQSEISRAPAASPLVDQSFDSIFNLDTFDIFQYPTDTTSGYLQDYEGSFSGFPDVTN
jgi:hypothetical protein